MNSVIVVSLICIGVAGFVGYAIGMRKGISEGREETIHRFTRYTSKQLRKLAFGEVFGRN